MVIFEYNIENFILDYKLKNSNFIHNVIQLFSVLGGAYCVLKIIKGFLEDGIMGIAFKKRIGKLE